VNQNFGSRQDMLEHLRFADGLWTEAVRTFHPYTDRLRRLAEAAELSAGRFSLPRSVRSSAPPELLCRACRSRPNEPPNRAGPADSWAKFDHARETLGGALADNNRIADSNYGIGAKVSAAAVNPHGVVYLSWRDGVGHMVTLGRDPSGVRGMRQHRLTDGTITATMPLDDDAMPAEIRAAGGHGTMVVFLGHHEQEDTTLPPAGRGGERWLSKAINQRFYELPDWASVRVREIRVAGRDREIVFRQARGQRQFLDGSTIAHGTVELVGARALWRILDDRHHERAKEAGIWASTGHRAALLQGELFELATAGRAGGYQKVQEFGIRFGYERVVIYVQPDPAHGHVSQDSVRTTVKVDGEPLPWDRYAAEFEERMPEELRRFRRRSLPARPCAIIVRRSATGSSRSRTCSAFPGTAPAPTGSRVSTRHLPAESRRPRPRNQIVPEDLRAATAAATATSTRCSNARMAATPTRSGLQICQRSTSPGFQPPTELAPRRISKTAPRGMTAGTT
jgi:hypothetical protein